MSADDLQRLLDHPLHRQMGLRAVTPGDGEAYLDIEVGEAQINLSGVLHGGVIYTLLDLAGYTALQPRLAPGEVAVTHDLQVSVLQGARLGDQVRFASRVLRRGRSLAFMDSTAHCGERLLARATITKSILAPR